MKAFLIGAFVVGAGLFVTRAQQSPAPAALHTFHVQGNVHMISGAGGNVTVQIGNDGILLVDTGLAANADALLAEVRKLSKAPIRYVINTHVHPDHVGGNEKFFLAGSTITGGNVTGDIGDAGTGAAIIAHEGVLNRMSAPTGTQSTYPQKAWPNDTYFTKEKKLFFNGEAILIMHAPAAHTDGDSIVFFRKSDVLSAGDIYVTTSFPIVDLKTGGNVQGILNAINRMIDIMVPADKQEGGTYVIPGHGRVADQADLVEYRDMVTIIRDRIADSVKKGLTLDQVKASKPTLDYDGVYSKPGSFWSADQFISAVYANLTAKK